MKKIFFPTPDLFSILLALAILLEISLIIFFFKLTKSEPLCKDCNIILVSLDTLGAKHLPCYGYNRDTTPNLCKFAKENIIFENAYSNATWTLPSHVSIFTGLYPSSHAVVKPNSDKLAKEISFLPEILKNNNYETFFYMPAGDPTMPIDLVYNRGIDEIKDSTPYGLQWKEALDKFTDNVVQGKKTFLFLHTYYVHSPYLIGNEEKKYTNADFKDIPLTQEKFYNISDEFVRYLIPTLKKDIEKNEYGNKTAYYQEILNKLNLYRNNFEEQKQIIQTFASSLYTYFHSFNYSQRVDTQNSNEVSYLKDLYDQRIYQLDENLLDMIFSFINKDEVKRNTVLIITSDHGEEFMEHGFLFHVTNYDNNIKIPLIMYIPEIKKKTVKSNVQSTDIVPTLFDILGIKSKYSFDGKSLVSEIQGKLLPERILVNDGYFNNSKVLRLGKYKLFLSNENGNLFPRELYDIEIDPQESANILLEKNNIAEEILQKYKEITK